MSWLEKQMRWLMLLAGALTCTTVYAAVAPQAALRATFGATLEGPVAEIVVRNWGALITLVGLMLVYGAFVPAARRLALTVAVLSKFIFIALVLSFGRDMLSHQVGTAMVVDTVWVLLFGTFLISTKFRAH